MVKTPPSTSEKAFRKLNKSIHFLNININCERSEVSESESCFNDAENRAASSLWVGAHRCTHPFFQYFYISYNIFVLLTSELCTKCPSPPIFETFYTINIFIWINSQFYTSAPPPPVFFLINCPPSLIFWEHVKLCMGSCYFGTLTDIPLGFRLSQSPIDTIPPGGFGGVEPPQRVDPLPSWSSTLEW